MVDLPDGIDARTANIFSQSIKNYFDPKLEQLTKEIKQELHQLPSHDKVLEIIREGIRTLDLPKIISEAVGTAIQEHIHKELTKVPITSQTYERVSPPEGWPAAPTPDGKMFVQTPVQPLTYPKTPFPSLFAYDGTPYGSTFMEQHTNQGDAVVSGFTQKAEELVRSVPEPQRHPHLALDKEDMEAFMEWCNEPEDEDTNIENDLDELFN